MSTELAIKEQDNLAELPSLNMGEVGHVAAASREKYQIQAAFTIAMANPRDENKAYMRLMKTYDRPGAALGAEYSFPRGGQKINGPTVSLAREAARCWGNIRSGFSVVSMDDHVHLKGEALDVETNSYTFQDGKFKKKIQRKNKATGKTEWVEPDERDLRELINKHGAILERNCILRLIPKDIIEDAINKARTTLVAKSKDELKTNPQDTVRNLLKAFSVIHVTQEMLEAYLGHKIDLIDENELADLRQKHASIKNGETTREEHFDLAPKTGAAAESLAEDLKSTKKEKA